MSTPPLNGEWTTVVADTTTFAQISDVGGDVWACGGSKKSTGSGSCTVAGAGSGAIKAQYSFVWDSVVSVHDTSGGENVVVSGRLTGTNSANSDIAFCSSVSHSVYELNCAVRTIASANFNAASYLPYPNRIAYIGRYNVYPSTVILDVSTRIIRTYIYSSTMKSLDLLCIAFRDLAAALSQVLPHVV